MVIFVPQADPTLTDTNEDIWINIGGEPHPTRGKSKAPCHFFSSGSCAAGNSCPFQHISKSTPLSATCSAVDSTQALQATQSIQATPATQEQEKKPSYSQLVGMSPKAFTKQAITQLNPTVLVTPSDAQQLSLAKEELCIFAMTGKCRYGTVCRNVHGLQCPRCLLFCLHPYDLDQNEAHITACLERPVKETALSVDEDLECGICLEKVLSKADPRFGLLNCEHVFCLGCIRQWRSSGPCTVDPTSIRSCPLCRVITYFIVPSSQFVRGGQDKQDIIDTYKRKLQLINCRHYDQGRGRCPFGNSCFYNHVNADGMSTGDIARSYVDSNEQIKVIREFRLSDFLP